MAEADAAMKGSVYLVRRRLDMECRCRAGNFRHTVGAAAASLTRLRARGICRQ